MSFLELFGTRWNFPPFLDGANDYEVQRLLDSSMETTPTQPAPTFEQSSTSAVCLRRQNTSEPYAFANSPQDSSKKGKGLGKIGPGKGAALQGSSLVFSSLWTFFTPCLCMDIVKKC